jgi:hypothetical protein
MAKSNYRNKDYNLPRPLTRDEYRRECKHHLFKELPRQTIAPQSAKHKETVALFVMAFLLALLFLAGCTSGEPPTTAVLQPLAQKCAEGHSKLVDKLGAMGMKGWPEATPGWEKASRMVRVLGAPEVDLPIVGYYQQKEAPTTIWPVRLHTEITFRMTELPKGPGETTLEKERVEKATVMCYAIKDNDGNWKLNVMPPTDVTPFYQKWWNRLQEMWRSRS